MIDVPEIDCSTAADRLGDGRTVFVDIRDSGSFGAGHIPGAVPLSDRTVHDFMARTPRDTPVVVVCYHGHSSIGAAAWLLEQGFTQVHSLSGGFTQWAIQHPHHIE